MVKKSIVRVRAVRIFEYPKSVLEKTSFIQDALFRGQQDMQTFITELAVNEHTTLSADMFQYEAEEDVGYKFRKRQPEEGKEVILQTKAARRLTTLELEKKHGALNHEVSPHLYVHEPEVRSKDGSQVLRPEEWYLREEIEDEFYATYEHFLEILRNA